MVTHDCQEADIQYYDEQYNNLEGRVEQSNNYRRGTAQQHQDYDNSRRENHRTSVDDEDDDDEELWFTATDNSDDKVTSYDKVLDAGNTEEGEAVEQVPFQGLLQREVRLLLEQLQAEPPQQEVEEVQQPALFQQEEDSQQGAHHQPQADVYLDQFQQEDDDEASLDHLSSDGQGYDADNDEQQPRMAGGEDTYEGHAQAIGGHPEFEPLIMNQPRQPVKGDIITFWDKHKHAWVTAKIREKVWGWGHYYNVDLEDGEEDGLYCRPPKATNVEQWSLREPNAWNPLPMEQLLHQPDQVPSRQITPETTPTQSRQEEQSQHFQEDHHRLELLPDQLLQPGRVHVLPPYRHTHTAYQPQPIFFTPLEGFPVDMVKYERRVREVAASLTGFPPDQDYQRYCHANLIVRGEQYQKQHSALTRIKNVFNLSKQR